MFYHGCLLFHLCLPLVWEGVLVLGEGLLLRFEKFVQHWLHQHCWAGQEDVVQCKKHISMRQCSCDQLPLLASWCRVTHWFWTGYAQQVVVKFHNYTVIDPHIYSSSTTDWGSQGLGHGPRALEEWSQAASHLKLDCRLGLGLALCAQLGLAQGFLARPGHHYPPIWI